MLYYKYIKTTAHKMGWPYSEIESPPSYSPSIHGWFSMYGYLQKVNINVSNAKRNMPKVIMSLKSKWFFIGITSILLRMKANPPCNTVVLFSIAYFLTSYNIIFTVYNHHKWKCIIILSNGLLSIKSPDSRQWKSAFKDAIFRFTVLGLNFHINMQDTILIIWA